MEAVEAWLAKLFSDEAVDEGLLNGAAAAFVVAAGTFCLMGASQMLFVTFGSWLRDSFGFSDASVAVFSFALGFGEVMSSFASSRLADRWGKERAGATGAAVMIPSALLLAALHTHMALGIPLLIVAIAAFEFAVVSIIPLGTMVVPGAPAIGMSVMLASGTLRSEEHTSELQSH